MKKKNKKNDPPKERDPNWKALLDSKSGPMTDQKKESDKKICRTPVSKDDS